MITESEVVKHHCLNLDGWETSGGPGRENSCVNVSRSWRHDLKYFIRDQHPPALLPSFTSWASMYQALCTAFSLDYHVPSLDPDYSALNL